MRMVRRPLAVFSLLYAIGAATAQNTGATADPIQELRARDSLTDEDRTTIQRWVESTVQKVQPDDPAGAEAAIRALRDATGSAAFREVLAAACTRSVGEAYKRAAATDAARLISVLGELNEAQTYELLTQAVRDERVAVRSAAAVGLRKLRVKIALAGGKALTDTLEALKQAGMRESSPVTLELIYHALDYPSAVPNPPDPRANADALLAILDARAEQYASDAVRAEGADEVGLRIAAGMAQLFNDSEKRLAAGAAARMLRHAVRAYVVSGREGAARLSASTRRGLELLVMSAERLLPRVVTVSGEAPSVTRQMEKAELIKMRIEFEKWAELLKRALDLDVALEAAATQPGGGG